ncbi:hypothetical protein [Lentilactobacillus kisonensis]|uniref:Uncharacterized protein n=2 Tax=Lentilactobacillus kisonensis TaxID=481722 RepID=H1LJV2_9LACO|nr:hypothetical protein [Lentilactobacillus kisonensis]EHO48217.1 hypothetical protein HMPREF9104_02894 [Lentilactobacillus kisonensis F0435]KRL22989.1 hypothetical protein FC98_GL001019 [Lentilactobacillus kisonensis DSM 19906 = JCM 15041]
MRANMFAFAFGIFALIVGIIVDLFGLFDQFWSLSSAKTVLIGSITLLLGLAFLSLPNRIERYLGEAAVSLGMLYYFYIQTNNLWVALVIVAIIAAVMEYGLRHR